jgi:cell division protein FtsQ
MKKKIILFSLLLIIVVGFLFWGVVVLKKPNTLPIKKVVVQGDFRFVDKGKLQSLIKPLAGKGFFSVNLKSLQAAIQQLPWVAQAEVKRVWPNRIIISVNMDKAVAVWNQDSLLNAYGEILMPNSKRAFSKELPQFFGSGDQAVKILDYYQRMNEILQPLNLQVTTIVCNSHDSWYIQLNNGVKLQLGKERVLMKLRRFEQTYNKMFASHHSLPKKVDLRYRNGLAVQW